MKSEAIYTQEQMDIALIKNTQEGTIRTIGNLEKDIKGQLVDFKSDIKSQFHLMLGLILGIYGMIGAAALGKVFGVL